MPTFVRYLFLHPYKLKHCRSVVYVDDAQINTTFNENEIQQASDFTYHDMGGLTSICAKHCLLLTHSKSYMLLSVLQLARNR